MTLLAEVMVTFSHFKYLALTSLISFVMFKRHELGLIVTDVPRLLLIFSIIFCQKLTYYGKLKNMCTKTASTSYIQSISSTEATSKNLLVVPFLQATVAVLSPWTTQRLFLRMSCPHEDDHYLSIWHSYTDQHTHV